MAAFSADWLALREPADHAARAHELTAGVGELLHARPGPRARALDLAAGTGSNVRYLMPRLPRIRHWILVDHDGALLAEAERRLQPLALACGGGVETRRIDLTNLDALPVDGGGLVTASALLDLVSEPWLRAFARRCREADATALCALTYDGRIACDPEDADDGRVRVLVNRHQRGDKGFGAALGPDAAQIAEECFRAEGFTVRVAASDWVLRPHMQPLQSQLVDGWALAAREVSPAEATAIDAWRGRRLEHIAAGRSRLRVGHQDLAAWLTTSHA